MATKKTKTSENRAAENKPLEKLDDEKLAEAEAEARGERPELADHIEESDLPKRDEVPVRVADDADPNDAWTAQHPDREDEHFVAPEERPGQYVSQHELPTAEGLRDIGVTNPAAYLASVPVKK